MSGDDRMDDQAKFRAALERGDKEAIAHAVAYYPQSIAIDKKEYYQGYADGESSQEADYAYFLYDELDLPDPKEGETVRDTISNLVNKNEVLQKASEGTDIKYRIVGSILLEDRLTCITCADCGNDRDFIYLEQSE